MLGFRNSVKLFNRFPRPSSAFIHQQIRNYSEPNLTSGKINEGENEFANSIQMQVSFSLPQLNLTKIIKDEIPIQFAIPIPRIETQTAKKSLRILLFSSMNNGMTQHIQTHLIRKGHSVQFQQADSQEAMMRAARDFNPDMIICPTLMTAIPRSIYESVLCLIVHPGIPGDRGPSSLDWAILNRYTKWGVTIIEAGEEMDAGNIWATGEFSMDKNKTKAQIYNENVIGLATTLVLDSVDKFLDPRFQPVPLDYKNPRISGYLHETIKQTHKSRIIDWENDTTQTILTKMRAADSSPGLKAAVSIANGNGNEQLTRFLYNGTNATEMFSSQEFRFRPGSIIGKEKDEFGGVYIGTKDGVILVGCMRAPKTNQSLRDTIKVPSTLHLGKEKLESVPIIPTPDNSHYLSFTRNGPIGILKYNFYNGAMSSGNCNAMESAFNKIKELPGLQAIILVGGSNGINLNVIQHSIDPPAEAMHNLMQINKIVKSILRSTDILTISALDKSAGAGGVYLALASDFVFGKSGIVLNPHYSRMGLFGSELHTYSGSKRMGSSKFKAMIQTAPSLSVEDAEEIGLIDNLQKVCLQHNLPKQIYSGGNFIENVEEFAKYFVKYEAKFDDFVIEKKKSRAKDEIDQPLDSYEKYELEQMNLDIFEDRNSFKEKREKFVFKMKDGKNGEVPEKKIQVNE